MLLKRFPKFLYHPSSSANIATHNILRSIVELLLGCGRKKLDKEDSKFTSLTRICRLRANISEPSLQNHVIQHAVVSTFCYLPNSLLHMQLVLKVCQVFIHVCWIHYCQKHAFKVDDTGVERQWDNILDKPVVRTATNT